jgi:hypothetical protein
VPARYVGLMQGVARQCLPYDGTLASLFSPDAYALLCKRSASPFWFWRIVAHAAELTKALPMQIPDIERGVAELRHRCLIGSAWGQSLSSRPSLSSMLTTEIVGLQREGFIVSRLGLSFDATVRETMELNPLFTMG